ncbi:MAG: FRG domain-containing protein [Actinobacteria bacterium]|nr:FRG domain-containing protein [Actinomycetota bacterium]
MKVKDFWQPWEEIASDWSKVEEFVHGVFDRWADKGRIFVWRGQTNAEWPLWNSLYRQLAWTSRTPPTERALYETEVRILRDIRSWGLHMAEYGRLSVLGQLAVLQHYGIPTRLLDVTFNPWIGLWFAVEQKYDNGTPRAETDARFFAFDVTDRLINDNPDYQDWEDAMTQPWPSPPSHAAPAEAKRAYSKWTSRVWAWRPPHFHPRLAAQNGGFLFSGAPVTGGSTVWPRSTTASAARWRADDVRQAISLGLRVHKMHDGAGRPATNAAYTVRIEAAAVPEIRTRLQQLFGYQHRTIYPDYTGFASYGTQYLKSEC